MTALTRSYVHGASDIPLLGDTIGEHFDDGRAPLAGPRGARCQSSECPLDL